MGLIEFLDLLHFEEIFDHVYREPGRETKLGHYRMIVGILMLLFIGFNTLWHFVYVRLDAMVCGFFQLPRLQAASTFWRHKDSLSINQARSILKVGGALRLMVWQVCGLKYRKIHIFFITTETAYGNQEADR